MPDNKNRTPRRRLAAALLAGFFVAAPFAALAIHPDDPASAPLTLTEREKAWLDDHPVIRAGHDPSWAPIDFSDSTGEPSGIAADMIAVLSERLDLDVEYAPYKTWSEA